MGADKLIYTWVACAMHPLSPILELKMALGKKEKKKNKTSYSYNMWTTKERRKVSDVLGLVPTPLVTLSSKVAVCYMQTCWQALMAVAFRPGHRRHY